MTSAELSAKLKKQPLGLLSGLVVFACVGWTYHRSGELDTRKADFEAKSSESTKMSGNVRNAEKLVEQVEEMKALAKDMDARLIRPAQLAVNLQYFYKLEAETAVKLVDVRQGTPGKPPARSVYVPVPYTVSIQGSFAQVMTFIQRLESGPHFCRFNNVTFTKSVATGGEVALAEEPAADVMTVSLNLDLLGTP